MRHNFIDATIECHGIHTTMHKTAHFNDKKLDVFVDTFARSLIAGKNLGVPQARDSVVASDVAWQMLHDAIKNSPPVKGTKKELDDILKHRRSLRSGFGLPVRPQDCPKEEVHAPTLACGEDLCGIQEQQRAEEAKHDGPRESVPAVC
jgi:hypothetical protein